MLNEIGPVEIEVPRDRDGTFESGIVRKRQRRLDGVDQIVLSLSARGLTTGEIAAHFSDVYGATVSKDTISKTTDKALKEMVEWRDRRLDRVYPVVFIDAVDRRRRQGHPIRPPRHPATADPVALGHHLAAPVHRGYWSTTNDLNPDHQRPRA